MLFIDTNILIKKLKDEQFPVDVKGCSIASVSGLEFLGSINKSHTNRAIYHIPYKLGSRHSVDFFRLMSPIEWRLILHKINQVLLYSIMRQSHKPSISVIMSY